MSIYFDNSRPERTKRARRQGRITPVFDASPIPPAKSYELLSPNELLDGVYKEFVYDVESYYNYFLVSFKDIISQKVIYFENSPSGIIINGQIVDQKLWIEILGFVIYRFLIIGFNSINYDLPMVADALLGLPAFKLKELSNEIVSAERAPFNPHTLRVNHIDLIEVAPLTGSLKIYTGRLHCERMQDLPYHHTKELTYEEAQIVRDYNINDLDNTELLYRELLPLIELREEIGKDIGKDIRSRSDAQLSEDLIRYELTKILGKIPPAREWHSGDTFNFKVPSNIKFQTEKLNAILGTIERTVFTINEVGQPKCETIDGFQFSIGKTSYQIGLGGLHSNEKSISYYSTGDCYLVDEDVTGFYPRIILNQGLYPQHLGPAFLEVFGGKIILRREQAKALGDKKLADKLKVPANGTFGKFGDRFCKLLYAPDLLMQTTISGQLYLLMNIEAMELAGFEVVSANTDGFVTKVPKMRYEEFANLCKEWEQTTGFVLEETRYESIHSRDVNNYIAIKENKECKTKGVYCERGSALNSVLSKNPETLILSDAVQAYLASQTPIQETIGNSRDIKRFISVRNVKGGGEKEGVYLGKAIRWYYSINERNSCINYAGSGNKVPKSDGAKPCMIMPEHFPNDLNYDWYIEEAYQILYDLGVNQRPSERKLL